MARRLYRALRLRAANGSYAALKKEGLSLVREPGNQIHAYVSAEAQVHFLEQAGFEKVRIFGLQGQEIDQATAAGQNTDSWLYYLCNAR